jgi:hypothetical protein
VAEAVHRTDLKWIAGILLFIVLQLLFLLACLIMITSEPTALNIMSDGLASVYNLEKGFNDVSEINQLKQVFQANPKANIKPIAGFPVALETQDISALSKEIKISICHQIAQHIYNGETEKYTDSEAKDKAGARGQPTIRPEFMIFALITRENHEKLIMVLLIWSVFALAMLGVLIGFSAGFGRITSPGFAIMLSGMPGAAFFYLVKLVLQNQALFPKPEANEGMSAVMGYIASITLPPALDEIIMVYYISIGLGVALILTALIARIVWGIFHHQKETPASTE